MRYVSTALSAALLVGLVACGGGSGQTTLSGPAPVQAASGFSDATLDGTYGVSFVGADVKSDAIEDVGDGIATLAFDGQGNITSGSVTQYNSSGTCTFALSGTYSVSSTGAVAVTLNAGNASTGCTSTGPATYSGEVSATGEMAVFAESDGGTSGGSFLSATAVKQQ